MMTGVSSLCIGCQRNVCFGGIIVYRFKGQCAWVPHSSVFKDVISMYPEYLMCKTWVKNSTTKHFPAWIAGDVAY